MPQREETQWERAERLAQERTEYAHVIVDEAQDLTPMQWRMVGRRGRHATWTVVGDPAQSSWSDPDEAAAARDEALGSRPRRRFELTVNYRNPAEIAELAAKVLALAMPGSTSPSAVRSTGVEPRFAVVEESLARTVRAEAARLLGLVDGTVGVVVAMNRREEARRWLAGLGDRVVALGSLEAKGLEYDATVVVSPAEIADESPAGLRVLYVALTRATQQLTVVSGERDEPDASGCRTCCATERRAGERPQTCERPAPCDGAGLPLSFKWHRPAMLASRQVVARSDEGWARGLGSSRCHVQGNKRSPQDNSRPAGSFGDRAAIVPRRRPSLPTGLPPTGHFSYGGSRFPKSERTKSSQSGAATAYPVVGATIGRHNPVTR